MVENGAVLAETPSPTRHRRLEPLRCDVSWKPARNYAFFFPPTGALKNQLELEKLLKMNFFEGGRTARDLPLLAESVKVGTGKNGDVWRNQCKMRIVDLREMLCSL